MNRYALAMGISIAACSFSVILLVLKCYSLPIDWPWVFLPVLILACVWLVSVLVAIALYVLNDLMGGKLW